MRKLKKIYNITHFIYEMHKKVTLFFTFKSVISY